MEEGPVPTDQLLSEILGSVNNNVSELEESKMDICDPVPVDTMTVQIAMEEEIVVETTAMVRDDSDSDSSSVISDISNPEDGEIELEMEEHERHEVAFAPRFTKPDQAWRELEGNEAEKEDLNIEIALNEDIEFCGTVHSFVGELVIIESDFGVVTTQPHDQSQPSVQSNISPLLRALDIGSIICDSSRKFIGRVREVFGPVKHPFYVVQFFPNKLQLDSVQPAESVNLPDAPPLNGETTDIHNENGVSEEQPVTEPKQGSFRLGFGFGDKMFSPARLRHVIHAKEVYIPGSDASCENDREISSDDEEYSDDEKERLAKSNKKGKNRVAVVEEVIDLPEEEWAKLDDECNDGSVRLDTTDTRYANNTRNIKKKGRNFERGQAGNKRGQRNSQAEYRNHTTTTPGMPSQSNLPSNHFYPQHQFAQIPSIPAPPFFSTMTAEQQMQLQQLQYLLQAQGLTIVPQQYPPQSAYPQYASMNPGNMTPMNNATQGYSSTHNSNVQPNNPQYGSQYYNYNPNNTQ